MQTSIGRWFDSGFSELLPFDTIKGPDQGPWSPLLWLAQTSLIQEVFFHFYVCFSSFI